ncbi:DUF1190 domain-containing protein [Pseudoroseicyclus aestuarii]|uniref:Uncharacterized protein YgiB involved in biofilm formation n=1 Tax=Pseudoroseicyclus aestuarii TaxID=1795041 RepID=A0A318SRI5_9RHOB|nr:DUF1190 domain-containing protein [Pseudoroseicyclus aestuarii]PYE84015.1 uncharacterized protein YgiB involved in biofilm formation [Pseudoroseicyclus aestuarii]
MRKRSTTVALGILGAASFALAGCRDEQVEAQAFPDLQSCQSAVGDDTFSAADCEAAFAEAETLHVESAPRYENLALCEEEHGEGNCGDEQSVAQTGSGNIFMPLLAGYLIGNMMSGRGGMSAAQPLYRSGDGRFTNAAGTSSYSSNRGAATLNQSQFRTPPRTAGQPPMTRATLSSRGGFGATGGTRGFGG